MTVDQDFRLQPTLWPTLSAWLSETVQNFERLASYDLTLDDAISYDWSRSMHALAQSASNYCRVPYEEIERAVVSEAFDGMRKTTKRGVETRELYHETNATDDSVLAHRTYGRQSRQTYLHAALVQARHPEVLPNSSKCVTGDWIS